MFVINLIVWFGFSAIGFGIAWVIKEVSHERYESKLGHWLVNATEDELHDYVNRLKKVYR